MESALRAEPLVGADESDLGRSPIEEPRAASRCRTRRPSDGRGDPGVRADNLDLPGSGSRSGASRRCSRCGPRVRRRTPGRGHSLGMKQRLGLGAALLGEPRILVLDEPANGLDPAGIRWLRDLLRSLANGGRSILISSHVLAEVAAIADEAVVINHGRSVTPASHRGIDWRRCDRPADSGSRCGRDCRGPSPEGATVEAADSGTFVVAGKTGEEIGRVVAAKGLVISELAPISRSLETSSRGRRAVNRSEHEDPSAWFPPELIARTRRSQCVSSATTLMRSEP